MSSNFNTLSEDEQDLLMTVPWAVFAVVADADGETDEAERARFFALLEEARKSSSPLMTAVVNRMFQSNGAIKIDELLEAKTPHEILVRSGQTLRRAFENEETSVFLGELMDLGHKIAEASGGFLGLFGSKKSTEEGNALELVRKLLSEGPPRREG